MANFSKSTMLSNPKKGSADTGKSTVPSVQLADNRAERTTQLKLSALANSGKSDEAIQRVGVEEDALQTKESSSAAMKSTSQNPLASPVQRTENRTGLPDQLKSGVEGLSGYSLDDVKVHYNSSKPAQLQAHAYAQGSDIHIAPGQENHLPHEAWHVVQQKQGRVKSTRQLKGAVNINDDAGLESEADVMGAKAMQFRTSAVVSRQIPSTGTTVQRSEDTAMTDHRMDALVKRVLAILGALSAEGQDWEKTYGDKGKALGQQGVEKAKSAVLGGGSEKSGPSVKEKVVKEGLRRWWGSLSADDKLEMLKESTSWISNPFSGVSRGREEAQDSSSQEQPKKSSKQEKFESELNTQDLKTLYDAYKGYRKISEKIEEFEAEAKKMAGSFGSDIGVKVGEYKNEREFISKFEAQRGPYKIARLEYAFLKETIEKNKDSERYRSELEALSDALDVRLQGPSAIIQNPGRFTRDKESMVKSTSSIAIAYENLKIANVVRNGTTSLLSNLGIGIGELYQNAKKFFGGLLGETPEVQPDVAQKQKELVTAIQSVCGKSWYWHTSGVFASKPTGVAEVGSILKGANHAQELSVIREYFTKPEEDLAQTEKDISSTDEEMGKLSGSLQKDMTVDKLLSETRTQKSTEEYGGKQLDNSSRLAELGIKRGKLTLKQGSLKKKIKGENRKPLTQIFYNAIKDLQPDNVLSLSKTLVIMNQIGAELDNQKHTKE